ncbi:HTH-type transcriptional regulator CysL [bioreactor metagenome]|uniref:HTH-type transcriptional regulator CysL n=1 Tax=bioreactor metagenome TaxID=1076179 RepID=A0A644ZWA5_9ZZZZ
MEHVLGGQLLHRSNKGVTPTELGTLVFRHAQAITEAYDKMLFEAKELESSGQVLTILATPSIHSYALPCTLYQIKKKYPTYSLQLQAVSSDAIEDMLLKGRGDIGFIAGRPKSKELIERQVFSDFAYLVAGEGLSVPPKISRAELCRYPLLMLTEAQKTQQLLHRYFVENGIALERLQVLYQLDSIESIKVSAVQGYGLAFLPYMAIKKELYHKQLRIVELDCGRLEFDYYSVKRAASSADERVRAEITRYIESSISETIC